MAHQVEELAELNAKLSDFVKVTCEGRKDSHGYAHMQEVAEDAYNLYYIVFPDSQKFEDLKKVMTIAWLHDVADHKYDKDGKLMTKVIEMVHEIFPNQEESRIIILAIISISYSWEIKSRKALNVTDSNIFWKNLFGDNAILRHIVSDVDKLLALGKKGYDRCVEYNLECDATLNDDEVKKLVKQHFYDKLIHLPDFIITAHARQEAKKKSEELMEILKLDIDS